MDTNKIVIFSGAGISAESGIKTFRDYGGLWEEYSIEEVATPQAWDVNPELVLKFYNARRKNVCDAQPNTAHKALARLEEMYQVIIITQNIDDLHERAGSSHVIHVHGEIMKARSSIDPNLLYNIGSGKIEMGQLCEKGSQLRPHVVWFGESVLEYEMARKHIRDTAKFLVIGTSLSVYPVAGLVHEADPLSERVIVAPELDHVPHGFKYFPDKATEIIPSIVDNWMLG